MADGKTPEGTGSTLSTDQQNLVNTILSAEFCTLASGYITDMRSIFTDPVSIPSAPTPSDIISFAGNLNKVIPAGFLLLHNDLTKEGSKSSSSSNSGSSLSGMMSSMLAVAGAGVVAAGIVQGIFGGFSSRTTNKMQSIIEDLNDNLNAEELGKDSEVLAAQRKGFLTYLKTYYIQQAAAMAISGTMEAIGEGFGKAIAGVFTGIAEKLTGNTSNKLQIIINYLLDTIDAEEYSKDEEVQSALRKGTITYLKTYMAVQTEKLAVSTVIGSIGDAVGSMIGGVFRGIFDSITGKTTSKLQLIVESLLDSVQSHSEEYIQDPEVGVALKEGVINYLKTYMNVQSEAMARKETASSLGEAAAGAVVSFFTTLFGKNKENPSSKGVDNIKVIGDTLLSGLKASEVISWPEIVEAQHTAIRNYVTSYLQLQSDAAIKVTQEEGESKEGFWQSIKSSVSTFWNGKQGTENKTVQAFLELATSLDNVSSSGNLLSNSQIKNAQIEGAQKFISSYYDKVVDAALNSLNIFTNSNSIKLDMDSSVTLKQEQNGEKIVEVLNNISELLAELSTFVREDKTSTGDVNLVNLSPREDDLSVSIPG